MFAKKCMPWPKDVPSCQVNLSAMTCLVACSMDYIKNSASLSDGDSRPGLACGSVVYCLLA